MHQVDRLLVGAPLGKNLQPNTEKSGALWKCPLSTRQDDCQQVETDGHYDGITLNPPADTELKEGQWMGVTVRSQGPGRKVMVCAHRYINRGLANEWHWGHGLCYTLQQNLDFEHEWIPCRNLDVTRQHEQYGYCQAGTSGLLTEDDSAVIGMPGPYTWRGTVFAVNISDNFLQRDKTQYFGPVTASTSPVDKYSYLGMAVAYGTFFPNLASQSIVAGAPRSQGTGQVVFFSKERVGQKTLRYDLIIDGEEHFSQFGYELCADDFDQNGMTDLVVGAPFHFTGDGEASGGAIYIYSTPRSGLTKSTKPTRILGKDRVKTDGAPESRFGFALASLGDLNKDSYPDLAVGAPFEGAGVVRIYLGGSKGLSTEPAQVIRSEDVAGARAPITFGYSLGGGLDIDGNGYPDLLIGSFCNDTVSLIRARPIVGIVTKVEGMDQLTRINPSELSCDKQPGIGLKCVTFQACFKMESLEQLKTTVNLEYRLEAETFQPDRRFSRVRFLEGLPERRHVVERTLPLSADNTREYFCQEETMFIKKDTRDIQTSIPMKLTYSLQQREEASKVFYAKFVKKCGSDEVCQSQLKVKPVFDLRTDEEGFSVLEKEVGKLLRINTTIRNDGEPAYNARLFVTYPPSISFVGKEPTVSARAGTGTTSPCQNSGNQLICNLGNPVSRGTQEMVLRFNVDKLDDDEEMVELSFSTNTTSEQTEPQGESIIRARVAKRSEISVSGVAWPEQVFYGGEVKGESDVKSLDEVGSPILHKYEVYNDGPSTVDWVDVVIDWPVEVQSPGPRGKWLLYLTKPPVVEGDGECTFDKAIVNPRNLQQLVEEPVFSPSVTGAYVGASGYQTESGFTSAGGGYSRATSGSSSSSESSYKKEYSFSNSSRKESSSGGSFGGGGSFTGDHHDRVVVEDTTVRKTDYGSGLNAIDDRRRKQEDAYRRRPYGTVAGDTEDDYTTRRYGYSERRYTGGAGAGAGTGDSGYDSRYQGGATDRRYQGGSFSEKRYGSGQTGGQVSATVDRRGYQTSSSSSGSTGSTTGGSYGGSYSGSSSDELERRYGAGQGFRTSSFDSQSGGGRYEGALGAGGDARTGGGLRRQYEDGSEYESEYEGSTYQGATGGRARRPGGRRRGYYRRRRPIGGATGGNQSYTYRRQYESRRPLPADGLGPVDLATRRDELSSRRVQGGVERVEDLGDGTRRTYQAHRDLDGGDGFERELTTEEDRRTRRDVGVRRRREREMVVMPEAVTSPSGEVQQVVFFDCARNTAKCVQFRCRINSLKPNQYALVHIQGRIWNHTLVEDYDRVSYVSIKSRATLQMDPTLEQLQDVSDDVSMAETIAYPAVPAKAEDGGVPIWVIVVSVLAGLLLLAIICLILWKLGFFKRRRPDPTLKSNISR
ncbi:Integrin alpha-PS1 [Amphibalanus amphitrite]|uniref:Integrin alpha-PS1 n=1 Tax=Amphibalanus amphitrite TaxID=1232801 RepID=A0A6A4VLY1_AMPAM|nr:Integrin alpha-PS1 [Amphibalanus amphitrite]